jgi:hypothetical protein
MSDTRLYVNWDRIKKAFGCIMEGDCPNSLLDVDLDCDNRCVPDIDNYECWKMYFTEKGMRNEDSSNQRHVSR